MPRRRTVSEMRESVMHKRAIAATTAMLSALFVVALPAAADTEYAAPVTSINWLLVVILTVLALFGFWAVQELVNRGR
jgi:hypothetical protein